MSGTILDVSDLEVRFPAGRTRPFGPRAHVHAVDGVSFQVQRASTFGIVGQSGSGKSTVALAVMRLVALSGGRITLDGVPISELRGDALRKARRDFQIVFQDPYASLDPRRRAGALVREPLDLLGIGDPAGRDAEVGKLLEQVGLPAEAARLFPHQFSGGQRQRLCIARALASKPRLVICDEPVSALDVAIQAQILNLMRRLQQQLGLTYLFISHDLAVVQHLCDEVAVMYLGRIVEKAPARRLFAAPRHPYTWSLIAAAAFQGPEGTALRQRYLAPGEPPNPITPPPGCRFSMQCPHAVDRCRREAPTLRPVGEGHLVACARLEELGTPDFGTGDRHIGAPSAANRA